MMQTDMHQKKNWLFNRKQFLELFTIKYIYIAEKEFCFPVSLLAPSKIKYFKVHTINRNIKYPDDNLQTLMVKGRKKCAKTCIFSHIQSMCITT